MKLYQIHNRTTGRFVELQDFADALALYRNQLARGVESKIISEQGGYEAADSDGGRERSGLTADEEQSVESAEADAVESLLLRADGAVK